jgi:hypothetical protein
MGGAVKEAEAGAAPPVWAWCASQPGKHRPQGPQDKHTHAHAQARSAAHSSAGTHDAGCEESRTSGARPSTAQFSTARRALEGGGRC